MNLVNDTLTLSVKDGDKPNTREVNVEFTIASDTKLMKNANLGKTKQFCKICGASGNFQTWRIIEQQYGTKDTFRYFECPECETLQIEQFPKNIGDYYSNEYYSYSTPPMLKAAPGTLRDARMILDVGCGAGKWLCSLVEFGLSNLYGCDPFIEKDLNYPNGVKIYKRSIHEMDGRYDVIAFNDSFEHMPDPHEVFKSLNRLLKNRREQIGSEAPSIQITLPVHPSLSVDIYGMYSFALDAPRHFFLYSDKALNILAEQNGFYIEKKTDRPIYGHLMISRSYQQGISWVSFWQQHSGRLWENNERQTEIYEALVRCASAANRCDHAQYILKRKE